MFIYVVWLTAVSWTVIKCEPPVNSYLPPATGGGRPSPVYGASNPSRPNGAGRQGQENNQNQPQDFDFPPSNSRSLNSPDSQYGPPGQGFNQSPQRPQFGTSGQNNNNGNTPRMQYGPPGQRNRPSLSSQPRTPSSFGENGRPQSTYGTPGRDQGFGNPQSQGENDYQASRPGQGPDTSYGPPPTGDFQSASRSPSNTQGFLGEQSSQFRDQKTGGLDSGRSNSRPQSGSLSSSYGTPERGGNAVGRGFKQGSSFGEDDSNEPAKYEYSYDVDDAQTGTNFHHSEQRDGDVATGEYDVVLPDGRKQVVEYEAGLQGYKPQIRYEGGRSGGGSSFGGGNKGRSGDRDQGYSQGGPGSFGGGGANNEIGYPQSQQNQDRLGKLEQQDEYSQFNQQSNDGSMGYPSGGPARNPNSPNSRRYPSSRPEQNEFGQFGRSGNDGDLSGISSDSNTGYPSGRPQGAKNNFPGREGPNFSSNQERDQGYPQGRSSGRNPSGGDRDNEGYPSGQPNGQRGTGY